MDDNANQVGKPADKPFTFGQTLMAPAAQDTPVVTGADINAATNQTADASQQGQPMQFTQALASALAPDVLPPQAQPSQTAEFTEADYAELSDAAKVTYLSTPVNLHMGPWEFKESKLVLDPDEAVEFESLLAKQPGHIRNWVTKADSTLSSALARKVLQSSLVQGFNTTANAPAAPKPEGT